MNFRHWLVSHESLFAKYQHRRISFFPHFFGCNTISFSGSPGGARIFSMSLHRAHTRYCTLYLLFGRKITALAKFLRALIVTACARELNRILLNQKYKPRLRSNAREMQKYNYISYPVLLSEFTRCDYKIMRFLFISKIFFRAPRSVRCMRAK